MTLLLLMAFVFCSAVLQALAGFGFTLILMPVATMTLGIRMAAPLVALIALTLYRDRGDVVSFVAFLGSSAIPQVLTALTEARPHSRMRRRGRGSPSRQACRCGAGGACSRHGERPKSGKGFLRQRPRQGVQVNVSGGTGG